MNEPKTTSWLQVRLSTLMLWVAIAGLSLGWAVDHFSRTSTRTLPHGPHLDAIYERFGNPDRTSGSGRLSLHYDLKNGQTVTLVVSSGINHASVTTRQ